MLSKYFNPTCVRPVFLQKNRSDAMTCGFLNGISYSLLITLTIMLLVFKTYKKGENNYIHLGIFITVLCWLFIPIFLRYGEGNMWEGYQDVNNDLKNQGLTVQQVLSFLQRNGEIYDVGSGGKSPLAFATSSSTTSTTSEAKREKQKTPQSYQFQTNNQQEK